MRTMRYQPKSRWRHSSILALVFPCRSGLTTRIRDPAPVATDCQPRRSRGVFCIRLVGLCHRVSPGASNSAVQPTPKPRRYRSSSTTRPIFSLPPASRTNSTAFTLMGHQCPASGTLNVMPAAALPSTTSPTKANATESMPNESSMRNLFMLAPNEKLTDRRLHRALAANRAFDQQGHSKRKRGAAVRVERLVRRRLPRQYSRSWCGLGRPDR